MNRAAEEKHIEDKLIIHEFRKKISWSIVVRYCLIILGLVMFQISTYLGDNASLSFVLLGLVFSYNLFCHLIYRYKKFEAPWKMVLFAAFFQIFDIMAITFLIYITGWLDSPYWFLYLVMIIVSGFGLYFYYSITVLFIALFSSIFYLGLMLLTYYNLVPLYGAPITLSPDQMLQSIFNKAIFTTVSFLLFAITIYYFSKLLNQHRAELVQKNRQLLLALEDLKDIDQMKDEFISTASHELRTPLSVIRENLSLIADKIVGQVNDKQTHLVESSKVNIDRLTKILDNILDISKIESTSVDINRHEVDLVHIADKAVDLLSGKAAEKEVKLETDFPGEVLAYADQDQIFRVFINLLDNAIKYTDSGGRIMVEIKDTGSQVEIGVIDSGHGISRENQERIFDRFVRLPDNDGVTREKGSGLGLSICKGIIDLHGGKITVHSKTGEGSKFMFTLPKVKPNDE